MKLTQEELKAIDTIARSTLTYNEVARYVDAYREGLDGWHPDLKRRDDLQEMYEAGKKERENVS